MWQIEKLIMRFVLRPCIVLIFNILGLRIVEPGLPHRIGHLVQDFDAYIKLRRLSGKRRRPIYIIGNDRPCNKVFVQYLKKHLIIIDGKAAKRLRWLVEIDPIVDRLVHDFAYTLEGASPCFAIQAAWGHRAPLHELTQEHVVEGQAGLRRMGLPEGAWFVCVHAREEGYSPGDDIHHAYRNQVVAKLFPAMKEIVRRGGWCVRMGHSSAEVLPSMPGVIDYALSSSKSDLMDLFLCAKCAFFLGSSSGLFLVSSAFGVPSALTNMAPLGCTFAFMPNDISIPKIYCDGTGRPVSFADVMSSPAADFRWSFLLDGSGTILRENTCEDIVDLAIEMLDRVAGVHSTSADDEERQSRFKALMNENNYSWGSAARVGAKFLAAHRQLLEDGTATSQFRSLPWTAGPLRNPAAGLRRRGRPKDFLDQVTRNNRNQVD